MKVRKSQSGNSFAEYEKRLTEIILSRKIFGGLIFLPKNL
jgi:hypothetical protein